MNHLEKSKRSAPQAPIFKKSLLAMCIIAATSQGHVAAAESEAEPTEVVVTGIRASLESAQNIKKEAATVKDVITSNDIGALPDKSVVEALQRVPGVAIERFEASSDPDHFSVEGGKVVVRGLNRVRSEFNGGDAFSARGDGGLGFSDIPPEMVGRVEVSKNQTSDLVEGGVAGTINLVTRKPFDKDGFVASATLKASYGDMIGETTPSYSGIVSNTWDTSSGKFGALLSISQSQFSSRGDGVGVFNYYPESSAGVSGVDGKDIIVPPAVSVRQQFNNRDRLGIVSSLQWESPSEDLIATFDFIKSESTVAWNERFIEYADQPFTRGPKNRDPLDKSQPSKFDCPSNPTIANPCQFRSGILNSDGYYVTGTRYREDTRDIDSFTFNLQYKPSDNLKVIGDVQYVNATNDISDFQATGKFNALTGVDLTDSDKPTVEFGGPAFDLNKPSSYFLRSAMDHISKNEGDSLALKLDAEYTFDDSLLKGVKAGVRASQKDMTIRETAYNWGSISETWMGGGVKSFDKLVDSGKVEQHSYGDFMNGNSLSVNNTFWFPSLSSIRDSSTFLNGLGVVEGNWVPLNKRSVGTDGETPVDGTPFLPSEIYKIKEDRKAVYARLDFGDDQSVLRYSGNVGLRYVSWQAESTGADKFPKLPDGPFVQPWDNNGLLDQEAKTRVETANAIKFSNKAAGPVTTVKGDEFSKVLPSVNLKLEIIDDLIARFAASESIYMPDLLNLRNKKTMSFEYSATPATGTPTSATFETIQATNAGNPYLQPETAVNLDLALEWYFADVGSLTGTLFHKDISDFFRSATSTIDIKNPVSNITMPVAVMKTENAGDATIDGAEIAVQTTFGAISDLLESVGVQASYTYIEDDIKKEPKTIVKGENASYGVFTGLPLEGLSQDNYNLAVFYDDHTIQGRLAYSWRSDYLLSSRDAIAFTPVWGEATGQLDASLSYQISDDYKVGLEANNLLDEVTKTSIQYNQEGAKTPRSYFVNDKRYALYVQAKF